MLSLFPNYNFFYNNGNIIAQYIVTGDKMIIGVPKEIKTDEYRVAVTPSGVK